MIFYAHVVSYLPDPLTLSAECMTDSDHLSC